MISNSIDPVENESAKEYTARIKSLLIQERGFPKSDDPFGPVDYVASILYGFDVRQKGLEPKRWGRLDEEMRDAYREKAKQTVASWAMEEIMASRAK